MAYKAVILETAQKEISEIVGYLADVLKSPQVAENFMEELEYQVSLIRENPEIFAVSRLKELATKGYRVAFVMQYVMLYTFRDDMVYIAHIFHQRQDYARLV